MTNPIELIVDENKGFFDVLDAERQQTVRDYLDMVLSFSYGRATNQQKSAHQFAMTSDNQNIMDVLDTAQKILHRNGYIKLGQDDIYVATERGIKFMEDHYSGQEICGVKIR